MAEVKLVIGEDYDAVWAEKLFLLKKSRHNGFVVAENTAK